METPVVMLTARTLEDDVVRGFEVGAQDYAVWGREVVVAPHTVDDFVSSLKRKLGWSTASRFRLQTVRGVGYRLEVEG